MRRTSVTNAQKALMNDLKAALSKHTALSGMEMLAVTSQLVGNLIALQDQRVITPSEAMELVAVNIETGNQAAINTVMQPEGRA